MKIQHGSADVVDAVRAIGPHDFYIADGKLIEIFQRAKRAVEACKIPALRLADQCCYMVAVCSTLKEIERP